MRLLTLPLRLLLLLSLLRPMLGISKLLGSQQGEQGVNMGGVWKERVNMRGICREQPWGASVGNANGGHL